jgi:hypothetical protein
MSETCSVVMFIKLFMYANVLLLGISLSFSTNASMQELIEKDIKKGTRLTSVFFKTSIKCSEINQREFLPKDIIQLITTYLCIEDIGMLARISRDFLSAITDGNLDSHIQKIVPQGFTPLWYEDSLHLNGIDVEDFKFNCPAAFLKKKYKSLIKAYENRQQEFLKFDGKFKNIKREGMTLAPGFYHLDAMRKELKALPASFSKIKIKELYMRYNQIEHLDLSNQTDMWTIDLDTNQFEDFDLSKHTKLQRLNLARNKLKNINISACPHLYYVALCNNQIDSISLFNNINIKELYLSKNNIKYIDLSKIINLTVLDLSENQMENIDLSKNPFLKHVELSHNKLRLVNLSNNTYLELIYLHSNPLESIDFSKNLLLKNLLLGQNGQNYIENIDLSENNKLEQLNLVGSNIKKVVFPKKGILKFIIMCNMILSEKEKKEICKQFPLAMIRFDN